MHGGKTPRGSTLPQFKDGRHSKSLPTRYLARYAQALTEGDQLLEQLHEIALLDSRLDELLHAVDSGEAGDLWKRLQGVCDDLIKAKRKKDVSRVGLCLTEILELVGRGAQDWARWQEITDVVERRRRLVESETKRRKDAKETVLLQEVLVFIGLLKEILRTVLDQHIPDVKLRRHILNSYGTQVDGLLAGHSYPASGVSAEA